MIISIITTSVAFIFLVLSYRHMKQLTEVKSKENEINKTYAPIKKHKDSLLAIKNNYENIQDKYSNYLTTLKKNENKLSRYSLGIGTMDSTAYKKSFDVMQLSNVENDLAVIKEHIKVMVRNKTACICNEEWVVNDRRAEGKKLTNREIKLRIRCLDNEVKAAIALVDWHNINRLIERLKETFEAINSSAHVIKAYLKQPYLDLKIKELKLSYEISSLKRELKDQEREERNIEREAFREEAKIATAAKNATTERELMEKLVAQELSKLENSTEEHKQLLELHKQELEVLQDKEKRAISMAQQTRAGFVYIISNESSFGKGICKIGMTRRVDPNDRVKELGDASVPELFDVHAFIYCEDAPKLEKYLHNVFSQQRVNLVNSRKEFFNIDHQKVIDELSYYDKNLDVTLFEVEPKKQFEAQNNDVPEAALEVDSLNTKIVENTIKEKTKNSIDRSKKSSSPNSSKKPILKEDLKLKSTSPKRQSVKSEIEKFARQEWPDDRDMQEHVIEEQLESKQFMDKVEDEKIKSFAQKAYPNDYSMQENVYTEEIESKQFMDEVVDEKIKLFAKKAYPNDYSMQENVYTEEFESKQFMDEVEDEELKSFAQKAYPNDCSMQEGIYTEQFESKQFMADVDDEEIKLFALKEYPDDYSMQEHVYTEQLESKCSGQQILATDLYSSQYLFSDSFGVSPPL